MYKVAVLTISDRCYKKEREDESGKIIIEMLKNYPFKIVRYDIVADEPDMIKERIRNYCDDLKVNLVLTIGGTGFGPRDLTPEVTKELVERDVPGIPEAMRIACLKYTKRAMLSRAVTGIRKQSLIVNLPGSIQGAKQSLEAIIKVLSHGLDMIKGGGH
jgi:molybdenum cofactor synthesis domain-containing protein